MLEVLLEQGIVGLGDGLDEREPRGGDRAGELDGGGVDDELPARVEMMRPASQEIHEAAEALTVADRQVKLHHADSEHLLELAGAGVVVRALVIHLVGDRGEPESVLSRVAVRALGADPYPVLGIQHQHGVVGGGDRTLHLAREARVARRVQDGELGVVPAKRADRGRDARAAVLLFGEPVHEGGAVVDATEPVDHACGQKQ